MKKLFYLIIALTTALSILSMFQDLDLQTSEEKSVTLPSYCVPSSLMSEMQQKKHKLDKRFSQIVWRFLQDLFSIMTTAEDQKLAIANPALSNNNIFSNVGTKDAEDILKVLSLLTLDTTLVDNCIHAYVVHTKGKISLLTLVDLSNGMKKTLDKYCCLYYQFHLDLPEELQAEIPFKDYLQVRKNKLISNLKGIFSPASEQEAATSKWTVSLSMTNLCLIDLHDWQLLYDPIRPYHISKLDLSKNKLKALVSTLLKGCSNLEELSLANNKLESLPGDLLNECPNLMFIDLSHNALKEIPKEFLKVCNKLIEFLIIYNNISTLNEELFQNKPHLKAVYYHNNPALTLSSALKKASYMSNYQPYIWSRDIHFRGYTFHLKLRAGILWN